MSEVTNPLVPKWTERDRQAALDRYAIVDTASEEAFDDIARIAAQICGVPIALISLLDDKRQWFKAKLGLDASETPRDIAFCEHAIGQEGVFEVPDAQVDERFLANPLVTGDPNVRFYAGAPLITPDGFPLGTLCVLDRQPNQLSKDQRTALDALARQVMAQLELRRTLAQQRIDDARQRAVLESKVEERSQELARVWRHSQDVMLVINLRGEFKSVNPAATKLLGWTAEELIGRSVFEFIEPEDVPPLTNGSLEPERYRGSRLFRNRYRTKTGERKLMSWAAVEENGLVYAYGRDMTSEVEQAAALSTSEDRLRQAQKMEAVGQLTGGLAHDFNNLLTGISGSLELLQLRVAQGKYDAIERYATAAQGAARRAAALTHRLLAFSRRQTLDPKPTDVNRLVREMEDLIRRTIGPEIQLEVVGAAGLWNTVIDPNQLENAVLNLCINARDAMPDGGRITIETSNKWLDERAGLERDLPPGQYLALCVTDTGTGMTPDVVARAFDPFFTTKPIGEGTGLGLSMIYGFARQSGGQVRIYTELGQGTTMCLYLPRHYANVDQEKALQEPISSKDLSAEGETVLVIDDEPTIRMLIVEVLDDFGYGVIEASDGPTGLRMLQSTAKIDLLITDVGLPGGINGRQVADAARTLRPGLKVLFITGYAENAAVGNGHLEAGMQVVTKPFAIEALAQRIRSIIEG